MYAGGMTSAPATKQVVVSILLRRQGDTLDIKVARSERFGAPVQLEQEHRATMARVEEAFVDICAPCLLEIFRELKAN